MFAPNTRFHSNELEYEWPLCVGRVGGSARIFRPSFSFSWHNAGWESRDGSPSTIFIMMMMLVCWRRWRRRRGGWRQWRGTAKKCLSFVSHNLQDSGLGCVLPCVVVNALLVVDTFTVIFYGELSSKNFMNSTWTNAKWGTLSHFRSTLVGFVAYLHLQHSDVPIFRWNSSTRWM